MNVAFALLIYYTPSLLSKVNGTLQIPTYYYAILLVIYITRNVSSYILVHKTESGFVIGISIEIYYGI